MLFLAGGITGCPDWQSSILHRFMGYHLVVFNPRRKNFPIDDPSAAYEQIRWERDKLLISDFILFWFCKDTIQPIVLFEYGKYGFLKDKKIFVGVEDGYPRQQDVYIQTILEYPTRPIYTSLDDLCDILVKELSLFNK